MERGDFHAVLCFPAVFDAVRAGDGGCMRRYQGNAERIVRISQHADALCGL